MSDLFKKFTIYLSAVIAVGICFSNVFAATSFRPFCSEIARKIQEKIETKRYIFTDTDIAEIKLFEKTEDTNALLKKALDGPAKDQRPLTFAEQKLQLALLAKLAFEKDISITSWQSIVGRLLAKSKYEGAENLEVQREAAHQVAALFEKFQPTKEQIEYLEAMLPQYMDLIFESDPVVSSILAPAFASALTREGISEKVQEKYLNQLSDYRLTHLVHQMKIINARRWKSGEEALLHEEQTEAVELALGILSRKLKNEETDWISVAEFKLSEMPIVEGISNFYRWYEAQFVQIDRILPLVKEAPLNDVELDKITDEVGTFILDTQNVYEKYQMHSEVWQAWVVSKILEARRQKAVEWSKALSNLIQVEKVKVDSKYLPALKAMLQQMQNASDFFFKGISFFEGNSSLESFESRFNDVTNARISGLILSELPAEQIHMIGKGFGDFKTLINAAIPEKAMETLRAEPALNESFSQRFNIFLHKAADLALEGSVREKNIQDAIDALALVKKSILSAESSLAKVELTDVERFSLYKRQARLYSILDFVESKTQKARAKIESTAQLDPDFRFWLDQIDSVSRATKKVRDDLKSIYMYKFYYGVYSTAGLRERRGQLVGLAKREDVDFGKIQLEKMELIGQTRDAKEFELKLEAALGIFKAKPIASADSSSSAK